jgi:uncharacterized protein YndB with AHSA1/START domain
MVLGSTVLIPPRKSHCDVDPGHLPSTFQQGRTITMNKLSKITVETVINAPLRRVWDSWNNPADIMQWNAAQDDWHTTRSTVDLREGGTFSARMEAKDGSTGFDFEGTYASIVPDKTIAYRMSDGREVTVDFAEVAGGVRVTESFDPRSEHPVEMQRQGWQAILDNFRRYVESDARP